MFKKENILVFVLKINITFGALVVTVIFGQLYGQDTQYKLQGQNLTTKEILSKWTTLTNKPLNYRADDLSLDKFTFSIEGTYDEVHNVLMSLIGYRSKVIDDITILTRDITNKKTPEKLKIIVSDEEGVPLPFVHVSIESLNIIDITTAEGEIQFGILLANSDSIKFQYIGYENTYLKLKEIKGNYNQVFLHPSSESISEIVIVGSRRVLSPLMNIDLNDIPHASSVDQDPLYIAQNLPGINNPSESLQDLTIRGGSPDQVQYKWNGIRILQSSHFFGKASSINPYMIDKMEISKDGYSASSSGTIAGGLHMKSSNRIDSISSKLHLNMLYTNFGVSIPISPKLSLKGAIRQSLPNALQSPLANEFINQTFQFGKIPDEEALLTIFNLEDLVRNETRVRFGDRQVSIAFKPTSKISFDIDFIHIENELNFRTISETLNFSTLDILSQKNYGYHIVGRSIWNRNFSTSISMSHSKYKYQYTETPEASKPTELQREQINNIGLYNYRLSNKLISSFFTANAGYEYNTWNSDVTFANRELNEESLYFNDSNEHALFLTVHPELSSKFLIDLGLRWSAYNKSIAKTKLLEPRVHVKYKLNSQFQLHAHYGNYHQYLSRRNFFTPLQGDNGFWYISDESSNNFIDFIDIIRSTQFGCGADFSKGIFDFSIDIYKKKIFNLWSSSLDLSTNENPFRVSDIEVFGIEFMAKFQVRNHHLITSYEYSDEDVLFDNITSPSLNPFSQPHRFNFTYKFNLKKFSTSLQYNFANGRPFSLANGLTIVNNGVVINFENLLQEKVKDYHRVDLSFKTKPFGKKIKQSFGVQINNIFDRNNIIKNQYFINLLTNPVELGRLEEQGIGRSFNILWEIEF